MDLLDIKVEPLKESIEPSLKFSVTLEYLAGLETLLNLDGLLLSEDDKILAQLVETGRDQKTLDIKALVERDERRDQRKLTISLIAFLNRRSLDYIEDVRDKNSKKNVMFKLQLKAKYLFSNTIVAHLQVLRDEKCDLVTIIPKLNSRRYENAHFVFYKETRNIPDLPHDMWLISGNEKSTFLQFTKLDFNSQTTISSSDWIQDFAPNLGMGKYMVVELPLIEPLKINKADAERINEALGALGQMKESLKEGEWEIVIKDSRPVSELLREESLIKKILLEDGYTEDAANDLFESIKKLFDYSSKFIHKVDKTNKGLMPKIKPSKEDAYLIFTTAASLMNLLARKLKRLES